MAGPAGFIKGVGLSGQNWTGSPAAFILTGFCNLRCPYCFEKNLVLKAASMPSFTIEQALSELSRIREESSVLIVSGGEPTISRDLPGLLLKAKALGFSIALETNGTQPDMLSRLVSRGLLDRVGLDVKARLEDESYSTACGVEIPASIIMESMDVLRKISDRVSIRTTASPGMFCDKDIRALGPLLGGFSEWLIQGDGPDIFELVCAASSYLPARAFKPAPY